MKFNVFCFFYVNKNSDINIFLYDVKIWKDNLLKDIEEFNDKIIII